MVDGVVTRIVEERETEKGHLVEISRNFFALDPSTGDVCYFGSGWSGTAASGWSGRGRDERTDMNGTLGASAADSRAGDPQDPD